MSSYNYQIQTSPDGGKSWATQVNRRSRAKAKQAAEALPGKVRVMLVVTSIIPPAEL